MNLSFRQIFGKQIEISGEDGSGVGTYLFDSALPKPCFHPLVTAAGRRITGFQMSDHVWHRGLWFTIKYINKSNFWEERPLFGIQQTVGQPNCEFVSGESIRISHKLRWSSEATGPVIDEGRTIVFTVRSDGTRQVDWQSSLTALQDLVLDRTPYTTWGGYSGMTFRASREVHGTSYLLPDGQSVPAIIGQPHAWAVMRGIIDGEPDAKISLGIINHPTNVRSPQPWYAKTGNSYDFMNAAFLFNEPMSVAKDLTLDFRYRVLFRDGWWEGEEFEKVAGEFAVDAG